MSGHTPGPWRVQGRAVAASPLDRLCITSDATDGGFVVRPRAIDGRDADTVTANARLIAAAPDLLALVVRMLDACFCDDGRGLPECARCFEARELLAKAGRA